MQYFPVFKLFCFALCTLKCSLVSKLVTRAKPKFFFCFSKISNVEAAMIIRLFHSFIQYVAKNLAFLCSLCKKLSSYISRKNVGKLTGILVHQKAWFQSFTFLDDKMSIPELCHKKNSQLFINIYICHLNI